MLEFFLKIYQKSNLSYLRLAVKKDIFGKI